ncbi:hypothetical protein [Desulfogranum marinum]|uniref:hypothetical protein n=1 Tax=Desulfogranum marinum TaxID=453220 RepID=UPI0019653499|nr:hypothetical protein [Desulfogranum marinum]MBM9515094.1 hypothetical protein [Desulfogranum marinum]
MATLAHNTHGGQYVNRLSDFADKWLFGIFVLTGAVAIIFLKALNISVFYTYSLPVGFMAFYAFWCYRSSYFKLRLDKAGDNLYYLGFLYTLVSLGVSLSQAAKSVDGQEAIIANFGIALVTTICGVAGRVFFTQLRDTPFEVEQETVSSLTEAARQLKGELNATLSDFSTFRTALRQSVEEWEVEWRAERKSQLKTTTEAINDNIALVTEREKKVAAAMQDLTQNLSLVSEKLVNIDLSEDLLKDQLAPPVEELQIFLQGFATSFQGKLQNINNSADSLVDFVKKETSYADAITKLEEHSTKQIMMSKNMTVDLTNHLESFGVLVNSEGERIEIQTEALNKQLKKITDTYEFLANQAGEKQAYLKKINDDISDHLTDSHQTLMDAISVQNQMLKKVLIEDLDKYAKVVPQRIKEIAKSSVSLDELTKSETSLAKTIHDLNEHGQQLITDSKGNMLTITSDIEKFGRMMQTQSIKLDKQMANTETHSIKMQTLYETMATNMKSNNQRLDDNVNNLSNKLKESYSTLMKTVQQQNIIVRQLAEEMQQQKVTSVPLNEKSKRLFGFGNRG